MDTGFEAQRTSRAGYVIGLMLIAIGVVVPILLIVQGILSFEERMLRFEVPGMHEFALDESGSYDLNYEYKSVIDGRTVSTPEQCPPLDCSVTNVESGDEVVLQTSSMIITYTYGSREGTRLFFFDVDTPGTYRLSASYPEEGNPSPIVLSVQPSGFASLFGIFVTPCLLTLLVPAGAIWIIVVFVKRKSQSQVG